MRLASYIADGKFSYGIIEGTCVMDLGLQPSNPFASLREFLAAGLPMSVLAGALKANRLDTTDLEFLPVIPDGGAIFCVGLNYADHARESNRPLPKHPSTFLKLPRTLVGHGQALRRPKLSYMLDWEAELAVVIGCTARHVSEEEALDYVAGYTCVNDGSIRDWQLERDLTQGKNFFASGSCGPWLVTRDEVPDPSALSIKCRVNGAEMQSASTSNLVFPVASLVSYYSSITELRAGDLISTGTPAGVGHRRNPKIFLQAGDVVEVEISGVGVLRNWVVDE